MMERAAEPRRTNTFSWSMLGPWVLALLVGALIGSVTTVIHQSSISVAGIDIPWGLGVSLATVAAFFLGLRLVRGERVTVGFGALGVLVSVFVFSQRSIGGSVLVPDNLAGSIWAIAPTLIATVIVAWPKLPERQAK
ncbi:MAG: hypothetical protein JJE28_02605 [Actinomycetales bacterium]|nr:hypothetical protein [Actinomycetales bacterium]